MSQAGEARTLSRPEDLGVRPDPITDTLRVAEEMAEATLEDARAEAERIRAAAQVDAVRLRAEAQAEATDLEAKLRAMEAEVAALAQQLADLEAHKAQASVPAPSRLAWEDSGLFQASEDVTGCSRGRQVASVASPAMSGETEDDKRRRRYEIAAAKLRVGRSGADETPRLAAERELGAAVLAASDELISIEREHAESIAEVRANARDEAARILEAARAQAIAVHARAAEPDRR